MTQLAISPKLLDRQADKLSMMVIAGFAMAFLLVDILSLHATMDTGSHERSRAQVSLFEASAVFAYLASLPIIARLTEYVPAGLRNWKTNVPIHIVMSVFLAALTIGLFVLIRVLVFNIAGWGSYRFNDDLAREFIYEYRKYALYYLGAIFVLSFGRQWAQQKREIAAANEDARTLHTISLKCGGRTHFVNAADIVYLTADGNYIDVTTTSKTLLVRATMSDTEQQLKQAGLNALRVHRSHIVNAAHIKQSKPDGQGGLSLTMGNGDIIPVSRKFRAKVDALSKQT